MTPTFNNQSRSFALGLPTKECCRGQSALGNSGHPRSEADGSRCQLEAFQCRGERRGTFRVPRRGGGGVGHKDRSRIIITWSQTHVCIDVYAHVCRAIGIHVASQKSLHLHHIGRFLVMLLGWLGGALRSCHHFPAKTALIPPRGQAALTKAGDGKKKHPTALIPVMFKLEIEGLPSCCNVRLAQIVPQCMCFVRGETKKLWPLLGPLSNHNKRGAK